MAFRATLAVGSKASRLPLTSKQGNKDFYKGTGVLPGLGPKAQGRHPRSKAPYIKDPAKMRYFVAPEGWLDASGQLASLHTSPLKPYVFKASGKDAEIPQDWPVHYQFQKDLDAQGRRLRKHESIFGFGKEDADGNSYGFDGDYYVQLGSTLRGRSS